MRSDVNRHLLNIFVPLLNIFAAIIMQWICNIELYTCYSNNQNYILPTYTNSRPSAVPALAPLAGLPAADTSDTGEIYADIRLQSGAAKRNGVLQF